ncbi:hypothetical protein IAR55_000595 [Kwoniella newhampshirensis]|uniref:F-box domain-containing protein n=1 Tax=Kwoniella newhampshirensis TaxID=1651941 RepID=A0AAW0Z754_9TREE
MSTSKLVDQLSPKLASTQVASNTDILLSVLSHLTASPSTLFSCLLVSRTFFFPSASILYRTITIHPNDPDLFVGSTRPESPYPQPSSFGKNNLLPLIRECVVSLHGINECPFVQHYIQPLPNLHTLHLAGGKRPKSLDENDVCREEQCQFVQKVCVTAKKVVVRRPDLGVKRQGGAGGGVLGSMRGLEEVVMKLRPCQLPLYLAASQDAGVKEYTWPYRYSSLGRTKEIKLVWWDERHSYRIEGYEIRSRGFRGMSRLDFHGSGIGTIHMKGCEYCDQQGCVRYSPHAAVQLPALMRRLGEDTQVERVRIYNVDNTAREQWIDGKISVEEVKQRMKEAFLQGRRMKKNDGDDYRPSERGETDIRGKSDISISFHTAEEYLNSSARYNGEIDDQELVYWQRKVTPTEEWKRQRVEAIEFTRDIDGGAETEYLDGLSEEELEAYISRVRSCGESDRREREAEETATIVGL